MVYGLLDLTPFISTDACQLVINEIHNYIVYDLLCPTSNFLA